MHRHGMGALCALGIVLASGAHAGVERTAIAPDTVMASAVDWNAFYYGRAVDCWMRHDPRAAAAQLENIDISPASAFAHADRAAFLLATAYLQMGDTRAFERVSQRAGSDTGSPYRRWIRYCALAQQTTGGQAIVPGAPDGFAGAVILQAALLLENGNATAALAALESSKPAGSLASVHLYLRALARIETGANPEGDWEALAARKPTHPLEADLIGRAGLELAAMRVDNPAAATRVLDAVPAQSRYYPGALQFKAMLAVESGDTLHAVELLSTLQRDHPRADGRRDTQLALGGAMMNDGHWYAALRFFEAALDDWDDEAAAVERIERGDDLAAVWSAWSRRDNWNDEIRLANEALLGLMTEIGDRSLPLDVPAPAPADERVTGHFWPPADANYRIDGDSTFTLDRYTPEAAEWERVKFLEREAAGTRSALAREVARYAEREQELARRERYLERGREAAGISADTLEVTLARLNALIARLDAALANLERVRDEALRHVAARTRDMVAQLRDEVVFMRALRHFHVDGPQRDRPERFPAGTPGPAGLLAREEMLALQADQFLEFFAAHYASVIQRSFDDVWRPHLAGNSRRLRTELETQRVRARTIGASIDSTIATLAGDAELAGIRSRRERLVASADSLDVAILQARGEVARAVAGRARVELAREREAIDYHLADATYELAVQTTTDSGTEPPDAAASIRARAVGRVSAFIEQYPESPARSESRYRLADLELMRARDDFRSRMTEFLGEAPSSGDIQNRALAPFVNYGPAIAQYEAILREDSSFAHTDAVLFNLGMILADDGRPDAMSLLSRLVHEYPESPDVQEAWLRMGNDRFDRRDFAGATGYFEHVTEGRDASFTAMALYKLGWARFETEDFDGATDAFAGLIDHYDRHAEIARTMDLRQEAEECLVHTLARSGGAAAFSRYFDRVGHRDYEGRILTSLASLLRSSSLYREAIECEELWLARYPNDPEALTVAQRMVETYQRWNKPDLARDARRTQAERFLPGSAWSRAQSDEAVRTAGSDFARSGYREAAAYRHARARKTDDPSQWRDALAQYETYLKYWPEADDSPRLHFLASDVATHMGDHDLAMHHLSATMTSDSLSLVHDAAWQRVAVADTWYRRSQRAAGATTGSDSLATLVLKTGDEFTSRFSNDPRCADIAWRQGNVALAHARYDDAAVRLERFGADYPSDRRALSAVVRSGDARYKLERFDAAGATYEKALAIARSTKQDSLATALETTIPTCYYQQAERIAGAERVRGEREAAPLFARVARSWPRFAHADRALYRAGLGYAADRKYDEATGAWEELLRVYPRSEYARDSAAQIAVTLDAAGDNMHAADAYEGFASAYPEDADAPQALLKAADLRLAAGDEAGAEKTRSRFIDAYPGEINAVMEIRATRARKELAACANGGASVSALLAKKSNSDLKAYLALAKSHPDLASAAILAQCDFLQAEETHASYAAIRLTQPLPASIEKKKAALESAVALYDHCTQRGVTEYTHASAYRIGQTLIEFGDALAASERPAGLSGDDLVAYDDVLTEQSYVFYDRGEDAWSTLLRQSARNPDDPGAWLAQTREMLWRRLGARFLFRPEVDYPVVRATPVAAPAVP